MDEVKFAKRCKLAANIRDYIKHHPADFLKIEDNCAMIKHPISGRFFSIFTFSTEQMEQIFNNLIQFNRI